MTSTIKKDFYDWLYRRRHDLNLKPIRSPHITNLQIQIYQSIDAFIFCQKVLSDDLGGFYL